MTPQIFCETESLSLKIQGYSPNEYFVENFTCFAGKVKLKNGKRKILCTSSFKRSFESDSDLFIVEMTRTSFVTLKELCKNHKWTSEASLEFLCCMQLIAAPGKKSYTSISREVLAINEHKALNLSAENFSDLYVRCKDGSVLKVHKNVVSKRSIFFQKFFQKNNFIKQIGMINFDSIIVKEAFRFIYTDDLQNSCLRVFIRDGRVLKNEANY